MACRSANNKEKMEELSKKLNDFQSLEKINVNLNGYEVIFEDGDWISIYQYNPAKSIALIEPVKDPNGVENENVKKLKEDNKQLDAEIEEMERQCLAKVAQLYLMAQKVKNLSFRSIVRLNQI
jgi:hypothetical protein